MVELLSARLVKKNRPYRRFEGFFLDQFLLQYRDAPSAPNIQSQISDHGLITGHFDEEMVDRYVQVLNAGSFPVLLRKVEDGEEK
jgi:preprotein translocase subunit SecD